MDNFSSVPNHINFKAKRLCEKIDGYIADSAVAYIEPKGGGPFPSHTHKHDHYFIIVEGCATIKKGDEEVKVHKDESILVKGTEVHSVWNNEDEILKVIGITINGRGQIAKDK